MHPTTWFIENPVKVAVGIILLMMFGLLAMVNMPMQMSPDVERPRISVRTRWPGASPQEIEKEIVNEQEEQLKSVEGITKMSSECSDSNGEINLEFLVGTNMQEAVLKVNSQLQQVREYPLDASKPVIRTSSSSDRPIAWFILSARPPSREDILAFSLEHPDLRDPLQNVLNAPNAGLLTFRLRELAEAYPECSALLPPEISVPEYRKFAEDMIESQFERVAGIADAQVRGGEIRQLQVLVDSNQLAARSLTIDDLRQALLQDNTDVSAGDFWEGKRRYVVRTLGQYRSLEQVENQIITSQAGQPIYVRDVAEVRIGYQKPTGFVRRFGTTNLSVNCSRDSGANVIEVMEQLKKEAERLNSGILARNNLILTQVYDETVYIKSAVGLVQQNIILGGALTVIVLMLFLHLNTQAIIFVPLLAATALAAVFLQPWFFLGTIALILMAGFWFARGTLVVAIAIPTSIVGTFMILSGLDRSLNVISLAGLAFAVGMLVDNAVVVLENIFRYYQMGYKPAIAARMAVSEVWGAVLASTLTTLAVFLPVIFLQGEAGQLFADIALAISAAVGLSLLVSVIVIPTASARMLQGQLRESSRRPGFIQKALVRFGNGFTKLILNTNRFIQGSWVRRTLVVASILTGAIAVAFWFMPKVEYLPSGNRNLIICSVLPPPGYNIQELAKMGEAVERELRPYWDVNPDLEDTSKLAYPTIADFFYVARGQSVFIGLRAHDPFQARKLIDLIRDKFQSRFPGSIVVAYQTSIFGRGLSGGRNIDVEITGPELERLVMIGGDMMSQIKSTFPEDTQAKPEPSLDLASPELHVTLKAEQANASGITNRELGYAINAMVDGAYAADYFIGGEKIDLVIMSNEDFLANSQDIESNHIATRESTQPVRLDTIANVSISSGPEQVNHRERERAITISISPPPELSLEDAINMINGQIIAPLEDQGVLGAEYKVNLSGTADKLAETWTALKWNLLLAVLITYLLMAALFESWIYPFIIILAVPMGAVGGILGLHLLGYFLHLRGEPIQNLDVLTMLGFIILIGTVVNNAILLVHQTLNFMEEGKNSSEAILQSIQTRIRPIFMTTTTTVFGLSPLVFFPGAGSELYRGLGSVVLGGLLLSTLFTLILIPTLLSIMIDTKTSLAKWSRTGRNKTGSSSESDLNEVSTAPPNPPLD
ncbi:MAG: efflux RND transporter permease subunit [Mariniblastus sp.]|nr:efflux RND transporter permease subunit [Mariniblastus sp.]